MNRSRRSVEGIGPAGRAEAVPFTTTVSGTVSQLRVYLDASSTATSLLVGLYTNAGSGDPGTLLAEGALSSPVAGAWNSVTIPTTTVVATTTYWIAVLGPTGTGSLADRDTTGGTKTEASSQSTLSDLPTTWTAGTVSSTAPLSAYATVAVSTPLLGDLNIETDRQRNAAGVAETFSYTATTSGTANQIGLYLDSGSTAPQVVVGLYADTGSGNPGSLLATATLSTPVAGAWNTVTIPNTAITAGTSYWIALLDPGTAGWVSFRSTASGGTSEKSSSNTLTSLPTTWSSRGSFATSPLSAYVAVVGGTTTTSYTYDPVGNRLSKNATSDTYDGDGKRASQTLGSSTTSDVYKRERHAVHRHGNPDLK